MSHTSVEAINARHAAAVTTFNSGKTKSMEWRVAQLNGIKKLLQERTTDVIEVIAADLGRHKMEAVVCEVSATIADVDHALANLSSWMAPEKVSTPLLQQPASSEIHREPKGVVLIVGTWNFPVQLTLGPMAAALAAGNCLVLKPSEVATATEKFLADVIPLYLDTDAVKVVVGGVEESTSLLKLRWDHIFYTGNAAIAKIVSRAAAEHLTPVTLELGGKSPTVVLPGANLAVACKRIMWGKSINAGQVCIAPDYVLVHKDVEKAFVAELNKTAKAFFGEDASKSESFGRIVSERHFARLQGLLTGHGGEVLYQLGKPNKSTKFIPPTLIKAPSKDSKLLQEEIFGPILPMLTVGSTDEIVSYINSGEKPLALYVFGPESGARDIIGRTSSGGVCVNDTVYHISNPDLPFGGVGQSGSGRYHGKWGFDEFSHLRSVMLRGTWVDPSARYPPYTEENFKMFVAIVSGNLVPPAVQKAMKAAAGVIVAAATAALLRRLRSRR